MDLIIGGWKYYSDIHPTPHHTKKNKAKTFMFLLHFYFSWCDEFPIGRYAIW